VLCSPVAVGAYSRLVRSRIVRDFETAFRKATGMWVKLVPVGPPTEITVRAPAENRFCTLVVNHPQGRVVCLKAEAGVQRLASKKPGPHVCRCFAGLSVVAVPVVADGKHLATLLAGQVLSKKPTGQDVRRLTRTLSQWGFDGQLPAVRRAYVHTPVITEDQFHAMVGLLGIFAGHLAEYATRSLIATGQDELPSVSAAKEFAQRHAGERLTMRDAARHVHISPNYFCKTFKKATGVTFTEYLSRLRVEKAKSLLLNPFMRVTEVAYSSGFQSIPHFNSVFKTYVGKSPTAYRESVRRDFTI